MRAYEHGGFRPRNFGNIVALLTNREWNRPSRIHTETVLVASILHWRASTNEKVWEFLDVDSLQLSFHSMPTLS